MLMNNCMPSYFIFVILMTMLDVTSDSYLNRSKVTNICNYSVNFDLFDAEHMKHDNQNHKCGN